MLMMKSSFGDGLCWKRKRKRFRKCESFEDKAFYLYISKHFTYFLNKALEKVMRTETGDKEKNKKKCDKTKDEGI